MLTPFHLAVPVNDLGAARQFYGEVMGCEEGRSAERWVDFDFFGHQFVVHLNENHHPNEQSNFVDGHGVPVPHFGVVLQLDDWRVLADRMIAAKMEFVIDPYIRFEGQPGEQGTFFIRDPSGNALEFKGFKSIEEELFAK